MNFFVAFLVAAAVAAASYVTLNKDIASKLRVFQQLDSDEVFESKNLSRRWIWFLTAAIAAVGFACALRIQVQVSDVLGVIKMLLALVCLAGAGCFDFREKRIPNIFPGVLALGGIALLALGVILGQDGAVAYITSSVVAAVGCMIFLVLASVLTKQGIGAGDIKLISALALISGVYATMGTLFFAMIFCTVAAVIALVTKLKKASESLPFGPFLFAGFAVTVFAINF